jgi:hypothetical protein
MAFKPSEHSFCKLWRKSMITGMGRRTDTIIENALRRFAGEIDHAFIQVP